MEDIKKFINFYRFIKIIYGIIYAIALMAAFAGALGGQIGIALLIFVIASCIFYVIWYVISLQEIITTRFVAMTENVLEITEMLEKKFEEKVN